MKNNREIAAGVARQLQENGFLAVFAGGCVRDRFLGVEPKDYDVATNATPDQIKRVFADDTALLVGESFGVIVIVREGEHIEVATLRGDGQYGDGRRPDSVIFLNDIDPLEALAADAARRDLTINAMFEDPISGAVYDFFGGREDLELRQLQAVGDARQRFVEDRLRMLRVVRFAAKLGFTVHPSLLAALKESASDLRPGEIVSFERIAKEMEGILLSRAPVVGLELLMETGLMGEIIPEMMELVGENALGDPIWHPEGLVWNHALMVVAELAKVENRSFELMFGGLLHDVGKPRTMERHLKPQGEGLPDLERISNHGHAEVGAEMAHIVCRRLKLSNDATHRVTELVRLHMKMHDYSDPRIRRSKVVRLMERPDVMDLIALQHADAMGNGRPLADRQESSLREYYLGLLEEMRNDPTPSRRAGAEALVSGKEIIALGFKPGPIFRVIKNAAFEAQHSGVFTDAAGAAGWLAAVADDFRSMSAEDIARALCEDESDGSSVKSGSKSSC